MFCHVSTHILSTVAVAAASYLIFLALLTLPWLQRHIVYLHAIQFTWSSDLRVPEAFGFLPNQATPFEIPVPSSSPLFAWHILPLGVYRRHESLLLAEPPGFTTNITARLAFDLLSTDPDALLVIHFHGAAGTLASRHRPPNYRALSAGHPDRIHVLAFDYGGFGYSPGNPSEENLIRDAVAVVDWARDVAGLPAERIALYGQSLGTAVSVAVAEQLASREPPVGFAGLLLTAAFVDVPSLVATYRVAKTVPLLAPLVRFPMLFEWLRSFVRETWMTGERIARFVRTNEESGARYRITLLHAEDDRDIPWAHSVRLFWHAVNACVPSGIGFEALDELKARFKVDLGHGGSVVEWKTNHGVIREEILKYGVHDVIMGTPVVSMAVMRIFDAREASSDP